jgi:hypothetical protein
MMSGYRLMGHAVVAVAAAGLLAAAGWTAAGSPGRASGAAVVSQAATDVHGGLAAVSASSPANAWTVGYYFGQHAAMVPLVEHWNGTAWKTVPSPKLADAQLSAVAAVSGGSAWVVGIDKHGSLIERCSATRCEQVASLTAAGAYLSGVAAVSRTDAWAVGSRPGRTGATVTLILHWNGRSWKQVPSPNPGGTAAGNENALTATAATSAANAWAVGVAARSQRTGPSNTLVEHWNGREWRTVSSPNTGLLFSVAASSARSAWAADSGATLLHWNGTAWKKVVNPPGADAISVAATSADNAWAAGGSTTFLHWNGAKWTTVGSPRLAGSLFAHLIGVTAVSRSSAWAVGAVWYVRDDPVILIERWNGTRWDVVSSPALGRDR